MSNSSSSCKYYTPEELGWALIGLIPKKRIKTVVDISCGNGALLKAARRRFPRSTLLGVDIVQQDFHKSLSNCTFLCEDGLNYIKKCDCTYDLILSNPPFSQADMDENIVWHINELQRKRMECMMLNANLSLMHDNSWQIIIMPSTFVIGSTYAKIRKAIAAMYGIYAIVLLPEETFGSHCIKTYALVLCSRIDKARTTGLWVAVKEGSKWTLKNNNVLLRKAINDGHWWENSDIKIKDSEFILFRGTVSSSNFAESGISVYHTAAKSDAPWKPSVKYALDLQDSQLKKVARKGDIIINRIGKAAGYWWINTENEFAVSDCVFVLRKFHNCLKYLKCISHKGRLKISLRGVATQYITKEDILRVLSSVNI